MNQEDVTAIVTDEKVRWDKTLTSVRKALQKTEQNFKEDRTLARELTSQLVATRRDEDKMQLLNDERVTHGLSKLRKTMALSLDSLLDEPYFARVVCKEDTRTIEFRLGTASFPEERIIDWRESPLAAIYYNHKEGESYSEEINGKDREGDVQLRRSYRGKKGELEAIELPSAILTRSKNSQGNEEWTTAEKTSTNVPVIVTGKGPQKVKMQPFAPPPQARSRGSEHDGHLPQILSLLTPDQYRLITSPADQPIVIQGGAGSGKTTVALHRLAWLLHEKNSDAAAERCLVVMLGHSLQSYLKYTLPELGVDDVRIETFGQWTEKILAVNTGPRARLNLGRDAEVLTFKALPETLALLAPFVERQTMRMIEVIGRDMARFDKRARAFWETDIAAATKGPDAILQIMTTAIAKAKRETLAEPFIAMLEQVFRRMSIFTGDLHLLWQDEAALERVRLSNYADQPQLWKKVREQLRLQVTGKQYDSYDDPLLLHLIFLKWGYYPLGNAKRETLDHLVIDEAQDFSLAELMALAHAVRTAHDITLVGDMAQRIITNKSFTSWKSMLAALGFKDTNPLELTVGHRSTLPIMELAASVRDSVENTSAQYSTGRMGPVPTYIAVDTRRDMIIATGEWIRTRTRENSRALCGIICRTAEEARSLVNDLRTLGLPNVRLGHRDQFDFSPGILITNVHQVKGLEFRYVLIVNPSARAYAPEHPESRNLLYVAITRAEERLDFVACDPGTPLLPEWLFEEEAPEEEEAPLGSRKEAADDEGEEETH